MVIEHERAVVHAKGREEGVLHIDCEWFFNSPLEEVAGQGETVVIVGGEQARWAQASGLVEQQIIMKGLPGTGQAGGVLEELDVESGGMGEEVVERDGLIEVGWDVKCVEVMVDVAVEVERALLGLLQDGECREDFGDGGHAEQRVGGLDRFLSLEICDAESFLDHRLSAVNNGDGGSRNAVLFEGLRDVLGGEGAQLPGVEWLRGVSRWR